VKIAAVAAAIGSALSLAAAARQRDAKISIIAGESGITVVASDPGITIKAKVPGDVIEPGAAAVSADRLAALIDGFAADASVNISAEPNGVTIGRYRLPGSDIPMENDLTGVIGHVEIDGGDCIALLAVASAAGIDQTRFFLTGVFLHSHRDQLVSVATNGVKLLRHSVPAAEFSTSRDLIVPARAAVALTRLIRHTKAMLAASGNGFEFTTRLIDFEFPDCKALVPESSANTVSLDRAEMLAALARLTAIASGDYPLIGLTWIEGGPLHLFLPRQPADGADDISAEARGRARIVLVPSQLTTMLGEFNGKRVQLDAAERLLITGENKIGVLMPCAWNFQNDEAAA
jgi:DNA polymerase III subunit beta